MQGHLWETLCHPALLSSADVFVWHRWCCASAELPAALTGLAAGKAYAVTGVTLFLVLTGGTSLDCLLHGSLMAVAKKRSKPNRWVRLCFPIQSTRVSEKKEVGYKLNSRGTRDWGAYTVITLAKLKRKKVTVPIKILMPQKVMLVKRAKPMAFKGFHFLFPEIRNLFLYLCIMPVLVSGLLMGRMIATALLQ